FWIFASIFTAMLVAVFGFAYWDRKTYLKPIENRVAKVEQQVENEQNHYKQLKQIINVLKDWAKRNQELADVLKQHKIL
ncbi:MAG: hypothetical protein RMJ97_12180, partial [Raineya sp.]|nr:hypothetical protein [Raineya sp.]